jgi:hypothetical protein
LNDIETEFETQVESEQSKQFYKDITKFISDQANIFIMQQKQKHDSLDISRLMKEYINFMKAAELPGIKTTLFINHPDDFFIQSYIQNYIAKNFKKSINPETDIDIIEDSSIGTNGKKVIIKGIVLNDFQFSTLEDEISATKIKPIQKTETEPEVLEQVKQIKQKEKLQIYNEVKEQKVENEFKKVLPVITKKIGKNMTRKNVDTIITKQPFLNSVDPKLLRSKLFAYFHKKVEIEENMNKLMKEAEDMKKLTNFNSIKIPSPPKERRVALKDVPSFDAFVKLTQHPNVSIDFSGLTEHKFTKKELDEIKELDAENELDELSTSSTDSEYSRI